jgi:DNA-binding LacI/PurR family transcriptional regulator
MARSANQIDVARAAGVSVSTVSRALSNSRGISSQLRTQIHKLAEELGYRARGAAEAPPRIVRAYVTMSAISGGLASFYQALVDGLSGAAKAAGLQLELRLIERPGLDLARLNRDDDLDVPTATLFVGVDAPDDVFASFGRNRPLILVNTFDPEMRFDCVAPNNYYGALLATRALLAAGHRKVLHVRDQIRWTTLQRHRGFMAAVDEVAGASGEVLDIHTDGDAAIAGALAARKAGKTGWTGIVCVHDVAAIRVVHALQGAGFKVPDEISVIGFDDLPAASMLTPRLSTMKVDCNALGREAIALLLRRLEQPDAAFVQLEVAVRPVAGETIAQIPKR